MKAGWIRGAMAAALLVAGAWAPAARSQEFTCTEEDTVASCTARFAGVAVQASAAADKTVEDQRTQVENLASNLASVVAGMNTGDSSSPTISDFLPLLRLLLDTGGSTADLPDKIGVEWNPTHELKAAAALVKSDMYAPLKKAMQTAGFGDQASTLEDGIDQGDDVRLSFSYSPVNASLGRDPDADDNHRLLSAVLHVVSRQELDSAAGLAMREANDAREKFIALHKLDDFLQDSNGNQLPMKNVPAAQRTRYIELTTAQITAALDSKRALAASLTAANFYRIIDLVNNQPQLVTTAEYDIRDQATGPDELVVRVAYETGGPNIKKFRQYRDANCAKKADSAVGEMACLSEYLEQPRVKEGLADGSLRFRFNAEYVKRQRLEFALPNTTFTYLEQPVEQFTASVGVGRYFGRELVGRKRARFDATASYEDFSDDPARQDRGLISASVTYPIAEGFFLTVGAVYATRPEFRGDVDAEISARAGFTYKFIGQ